MSYGLNKLAWAVGNPAMVGLLTEVVCLALARRKAFRTTGMLVLAWIWLWCTPIMTKIVGVALERPYAVYDANGLPRMREAAEYPVCDAIVDLGGGTGVRTNFHSGAYLNASADRVYFSACLWKAGKAPIVIPSGEGCVLSDGQFLRDLGVPASAIVAENAARNTEENAKFVASLSNSNSRILLVTSAWHMKRSLLMFRKYAPGIEVIPAPCDFECVNGSEDGFGIDLFLPSFSAAGLNSVYFHEWLGYWWYRWVRK